MNIFRVISHIPSVSSRLSTDRAHVLVLGVAQVGVLLDERVKVVGRVESNTCNY